MVDALLGLHLKPDELSFAQIILRAIVVYGAVILFVRFGKQRFLAQATPFDAILLILIGSVASRAVSGTAPFGLTLVAVATLIALHRLFSFISSRWSAFSIIVKGTTTVLIRDGNVDWHALAKSHMSKGDLDEDLRKEGLTESSDVSEARLERDGTVSVIKK
jgi:uncharacterized membrane protein YcaP (DUF421 family)